MTPDNRLEATARMLREDERWLDEYRRTEICESLRYADCRGVKLVGVKPSDIEFVPAKYLLFFDSKVVEVQIENVRFRLSWWLGESGSRHWNVKRIKIGDKWKRCTSKRFRAALNGEITSTLGES